MHHLSTEFDMTVHPPTAGQLAEDEMPFADTLLASLGRGATSCAELQEAAYSMVQESGGACSKVTRSIARIGSYGKFPGNCERDLFRVLSLPVVAEHMLCYQCCFFVLICLFSSWTTRYLRCLKEPLMVEVPCKHPQRHHQTSTMRVPVVLVHELLSWLAEHRRFYVSPEAIKQFWQRWKQFKPYHPAQEAELHNPLGIAGDDAKYTLGGAKIVIICVNMILVDRAKKSQSNDIRTNGH